MLENGFEKYFHNVDQQGEHNVNPWLHYCAKTIIIGYLYIFINNLTEITIL